MTATLTFTEFLAKHHEREIRELRLAGATYLEVAEEFNVGYSVVQRACTQLGLNGGRLQIGAPSRTAPKPTRPEVIARRQAREDRNSVLVQMREAEATYQEIGDRFDITRERVRQILQKMGRADLCHRYWNKPAAQVHVHICVICGKQQEAQGHFPRLYRDTCGSRLCVARHFSNRHGGDFSHNGPESVRLRSAGKKWREIGELLFPAATQPAARAQRCALKWQRLTAHD